MAVVNASLNNVRLLTLLVVTAFQTLLGLAVCPPGWLAYQDACYILLPDRMDWWQAKKVCDRPGSSLAVPNSQEENDFIWQEMQRVWMGKYGAIEDMNFQLWIGCTDVNNTGDLACLGVQGKPFLANWNTESAYDDIGQDCIRMKNGGKWADKRCEAIKFAACEMRVSHRSYCLQADSDGRFTSQCLLNHHLKNLTASGVIGCGRVCWADPRCHSFNLWQEGGGKQVCQLNNSSSIESDIADFISVHNCYFYDL